MWGMREKSISRGSGGHSFISWGLIKGKKTSYCVRVAGRRQWHPTPVLLPGKSHGWWSLVGCSPWGCYKSDMTEWLPFHFSLSCIGERNGNLLHCSCLENPRDREAWWAAEYGVAQSWTRLMWLSCSSSSSNKGKWPGCSPSWETGWCTRARKWEERPRKGSRWVGPWC